jgi:hypothetical protein
VPARHRVDAWDGLPRHVALNRRRRGVDGLQQLPRGLEQAIRSRGQLRCRARRGLGRLGDRGDLCLVKDGHLDAHLPGFDPGCCGACRKSMLELGAAPAQLARVVGLGFLDRRCQTTALRLEVDIGERLRRTMALAWLGGGGRVEGAAPSEGYLPERAQPRGRPDEPVPIGNSRSR